MFLVVSWCFLGVFWWLVYLVFSKYFMLPKRVLVGALKSSPGGQRKIQPKPRILDQNQH